MTTETLSPRQLKTLQRRKNAVKEARQILKEAKRLLIEVGWVKRQYRKWNRKGEITGYCSIGAISSAANDTIHQRGYAVARQALNDAIGGSIINFNDAGKTKKEDVLNAFDEALKLTRKRDTSQLTKSIR